MRKIYLFMTVLLDLPSLFVPHEYIHRTEKTKKGKSYKTVLILLKIAISQFIRKKSLSFWKYLT